MLWRPTARALLVARVREDLNVSWVILDDANSYALTMPVQLSRQSNFFSSNLSKGRC